ncbi:MAG: hypothetical protein GY927_19390 [bacterium]|nr:hypothetical protein [bacterium]
MNKHFIFRLGPVDREEGDFFMYYVYPGKDDAWAFPAASDEQGLSLITEHFPVDDLVCEEALSESAKKFGIKVEAFDQGRSHELTMMAYEHLSGSPMHNVLQDSLVWHFAQSVNDFVKAKPWLRKNSGKPIKVEFQGNLNLDTLIFVHPDHQESSLSVLFEVEESEPAMLSTDFLELAHRAHMGVEFHQSPVFVLDALQRAHGLEVIPVPYVLLDGQRVFANDLQLGILIVVLTAVASLDDASEVANGKLELGDIQLLANVYPT